MASLDSLPADQRAVLQLVLQRGRTYDDIAKLLSIDRAAVRQRAVSAVDSLGPQTGVPAERRGVITDYLLGQLPPGASASARDGLAESSSERAWARVVASELSEVATEPLPEIPGPGGRSEPGQEPEPAARPEPAQEGAEAAAGAPPSGSRATSRRGGALLLGLLAAAIIVVVVVLLVNSGGSKHKNSATTANTAPTTSTPASATATTGTGTTTTTPTQVVGQINLTPPKAGSKTAGIAEVLKQGSTNGIAIVAQNVPANTKTDAYAVWLYNSSSDAHLLGFVNPAVRSDGKLSTAGALPSNASRFKQLIVTRETQASPKQPGTIILRGALTGL
jgi:hypothetical protein